MLKVIEAFLSRMFVMRKCSSNSPRSDTVDASLSRELPPELGLTDCLRFCVFSLSVLIRGHL